MANRGLPAEEQAAVGRNVEEHVGRWDRRGRDVLRPARSTARSDLSLVPAVAVNQTRRTEGDHASPRVEDPERWVRTVFGAAAGDLDDADASPGRPPTARGPRTRCGRPSARSGCGSRSRPFRRGPSPGGNSSRSQAVHPSDHREIGAVRRPVGLPNDPEGRGRAPPPRSGERASRPLAHPAPETVAEGDALSSPERETD